MISARAGKDLVSSLVTGLLTIGPRFGGAVNTAAGAWLEGVGAGDSPKEFVRKMSEADGIIPGIGHKKYRTDSPDPRVGALMAHAPSKHTTYVTFARSIEAITTTKKTNLILNVDGAIAAIMLDLLSSELKYSEAQLKELVDIEFFNALFVLSRSVGFTAHYLDQRRNDEGLFRLGDDDIRYFND
jgi:citrate synthase